MTDIFTQDLYIRATHPYGFRSGQWAKVTGVRYLPKQSPPRERPARAVYVVQFVDGFTDLWPIYDPSDPYEFSSYPGGLERKAGGELVPVTE